MRTDSATTHSLTPLIAFTHRTQPIQPTGSLPRHLQPTKSDQPIFMPRSYHAASSTLVVLTDFSARISPASIALFPRQPQPKQAAAPLCSRFCSKSLSSARMIKLFTDSEPALLRTPETMLHAAQCVRIALSTISGGTDFMLIPYQPPSEQSPQPSHAGKHRQERVSGLSVSANAR